MTGAARSHRALSALKATGVCAILDLGLCRSRNRILALAKALAGAGIRFFQVRAKGTPDSGLLALAMAVKKVLRGSAITLNDRPGVALAAGADGVHLGWDDLPASVARRIMGRNAVVGVSAGNQAELARAIAAKPSYISIGPVFATKTKANAGAPLGVAGFARLARRVPKGIPVLAVGGITPHNVGRIFRAGAGAVAVASWWLDASGPSGAAVQMKDAIRTARRTERKTALEPASRAGKGGKKGG